MYTTSAYVCVDTGDVFNSGGVWWLTRCVLGSVASLEWNDLFFALIPCLVTNFHIEESRQFLSSAFILINLCRHNLWGVYRSVPGWLGKKNTGYVHRYSSSGHNFSPSNPQSGFLHVAHGL